MNAQATIAMPATQPLSDAMIRAATRMIGAGRRGEIPPDVLAALASQTGIVVPPIEPAGYSDKACITSIFVSGALDDLGLSAAEFRVYANLARRASRDTGCCYPGRKNIAKVCRLHPDTVGACLNELIARRLIVKQKNPGTSNSYRITKQSEWNDAGGKEGLTIQFQIPETKGRVIPETKGHHHPETKGHKGYPVRVSNEGNPEKRVDAAAKEPSDGFDGLPHLLNTEEFKTAWTAWTAYRRESRIKALKRSSVLAQWRAMANWGEASAIEAINRSIRNGYQGVFEPKGAAAKVMPVRDYTNPFSK